MASRSPAWAAVTRRLILRSSTGSTGAYRVMVIGLDLGFGLAGPEDAGPERLVPGQDHRDRLAARADPQPPEDGREVPGHRALREVEAARDLLVRQPGGDEPEDLALPMRQRRHLARRVHSPRAR